MGVLSISQESKAQTTVKGLYVDHFEDMLGTQAQFDLINMCIVEGYNYVALYGLTRYPTCTTTNDDILGNTNKENELTGFIAYAHQFNVQVGIVSGDMNSPSCDLALVNAFNANYSSTKFDVFSIEHEFWNPGYPFADAQSFINHFNTSGNNPHNMLLEIYVARWSSQSEINFLVANTNRILLACYKPAPSWVYPSIGGGSSLLNSMNAAAALAGKNYSVVMLYSNMCYWFGNWMYTNNSDENAAHAAFLSDFIPNASNFPNLTIDGHHWFTYSTFLNKNQCTTRGGKVNFARKFDNNPAVKSYIFIDHTSTELENNAYLNDFTFEAQIKSDFYDEHLYSLDKKVIFCNFISNGSANSGGYEIFVDEYGELKFNNTLYGIVSSGYLFTNGQCAHVAISVHNSGNTDYIKFYIDGSLVGTGSGTNTHPGLPSNFYHDVIIGNNNAFLNSSTSIRTSMTQLNFPGFYSDGWKGMIDEVRLWNRELTAAELLSNYNRQIFSAIPSLIANWRMGSPEKNDYFFDQIVIDNSSYGHHGFLGATNYQYDAQTEPWYISNQCTAFNLETNLAKEFDGTTKVLRLNPTAPVQFTYPNPKYQTPVPTTPSSFLIEMWVRSNIDVAHYNLSNPGINYEPVIMSNQNSAGGMTIYIDANGVLRLKDHINPIPARFFDISTNDFFKPGLTCNHIAIDYYQTPSNNWNLRLFVNGSTSNFIPVTIAPFNYFPTSNNWLVGNDFNLLSGFNGMIDDIRIWGVSEYDIQNTPPFTYIKDEYGSLHVRRSRRLSDPPLELFANYRLDEEVGDQVTFDHGYWELNGTLGFNLSVEPNFDPAFASTCSPAPGTAPAKVAYDVNSEFNFLNQLDDAFTDHENVLSATSTKQPLKVNTAGLKIYPNPFHDIIQVSLFNSGISTGNSKIIVLDITGNVVREIPLLSNDPVFTINLQSLKSGFYFLQLSNNGQILVTQKIIKI